MKLDTGVLGKAATIALLNLSLMLALGALAATPLGRTALGAAVVAAFVASTVGGFLVAIIARAPGEICGPASSVTVIYAALGADLIAHGADLGTVWTTLSLAVVLAGVMAAVAGHARFAQAVKFMPMPVSAGFVTGVGLLVITSQLSPMLGLEARLSRYHAGEWMQHVKPGAVAAALAAMATMFAWPRLKWRGQPALVALVIGTIVHYAFAWGDGPLSVGPTLGPIDVTGGALANVRGAWNIPDATWLAHTAWHVLPYSAFMALQVIMNGAVTAASIASIRGERSNANRTLATQGWVNVVCGALGALPVSTVASVSLPAARMGATPISAALSCAILFVAALGAGAVLAGIPVAVLAAILVMGGIGMIDRWSFGLAARLGRERRWKPSVLLNIGIVSAVAAIMVFGSVPLALFVGAVLAMLLLAVSLSEATTIDTIAPHLSSVRVWPAQDAQWLAAQGSRMRVFRPRGSLFFGTAEQLAVRLESVEPAVGFVILDLARVTTMDATGCQIVANASKKLAGRGARVALAGISAQSERGAELALLGLDAPDAKWWHADLDHALEAVELELMKERVGGTVPVGLEHTPLARALSADELHVLQAHLARIEAPPGPLFRAGDSGASLFVVERGFVEIEVAALEGRRRIAAFGPGSVFGEIALLNDAIRTADAVCVEASTLHELTRDALQRLGDSHPVLYTRLMENVSRHLADRLVIATRR